MSRPWEAPGSIRARLNRLRGAATAARVGGVIRSGWAPAPPPVRVPDSGQSAPSASSLTGRLSALLAATGQGTTRSTARSTAASAGELPALPGASHDTRRGPCQVITHLCSPGERHGDRPLGRVLQRDPRGAVLVGACAELRGFDVRRALFLDIETTGLSRGMGTLAFLVGAAHFRGEQLLLEQWLLRTPEEEPALLLLLADRLAACDCLVTYNGRAFDLPLLQGRFRANRMEDPSADLTAHLDLLHASRRLLRHDLPDCRLATVEAHHLGLERTGDIPGAEVPATYGGYLHGREVGPLLRVIAHNRDDVLSMVTLLDELLGRAEAPERTLLRDPPCGQALAEQSLRLGDLEGAARTFEAASRLPELRAWRLRGLDRVDRRRRRR